MLPRASPAKKAARTVVMACTVLPKTSPSIRVQTIS
jgi:hypothetical protein